MDDRLRDVLEGKEGNYTIPLFWLCGAGEAVTRQLITRVRECGHRELCLESRPHPDFLGPRWWRDTDLIMSEASRLGMRVWFFDDSHFPTGYAGGRVASDHPDLRKWYLKRISIDAIGPAPTSHFLVVPHLQDDARLIAAIAWRREPSSYRVTADPVDLTNRVRHGRLHWDIPHGLWRIFLLVQTRHGGEERTEQYLNPIVPEATDVLISTVYAPHYERYSADVGKTFAGFFSDEPRFGNARRFSHAIGRSDMVIPWRDDLLAILTDTWGGDFAPLLPLLWHQDPALYPSVRRHYMDVVSQLYSEHFSRRIGAWCRTRGLEYIGHVLEDNNVHARLGWGAGHFFRAIAGQDMAGVDLVLQQLRPGMDMEHSSYAGGNCDGEFYHYALGKLGSSMGHLHSRAKGRTLCEVFGAYGWSFGLRSMRWMIDHLVVRGVNHFMPHAFSSRPFPDADCPPHMYAQGHNPQFAFFHHLVVYMNRLGHLLNGGRHVAPVAVLYHAEAEWGGECMPFQKPVRELIEAQIDCDVVPGDALIAAAGGANEPMAWDITARLDDQGRLCLTNEEYECLVIPWSTYLPARILRSLSYLADRGLRIVFVHALPVVSDAGFDMDSWAASIRKAPAVSTVALPDLAPSLRLAGIAEVECRDRVRSLRYYHYRHDELNFYLLFNEDTHEAVQSELVVPHEEDWLIYDAMENTVRPIITERPTRGKSALPFELVPGEPVLLVGGPRARLDAFGGTPSAAPASQLDLDEAAILPVGPDWSVSLRSADVESAEDGEPREGFQWWRELPTLVDLSRADLLPDFCGTVRYESTVWIDDKWRAVLDGDPDGARIVLECGDAHETVQVAVNGRYAGTRLSPPYRFFVDRHVESGRNAICVEVTNTVVKSVPDKFSAAVAQDPTGLLGPVKLLLVSERSNRRAG